MKHHPIHPAPGRALLLAPAIGLMLLCAVAVRAQTTPPAAHRAFGISCETCHTTGGWTKIPANIVFDHDLTDFTLVGQHKNVPCAGCHRGQGLADMRRDCAGCHTDPHRAESGTACEKCHTTSAWRAPGKFIVLHEATRFPLVGAHRLVECRACHGTQQRDEYVRVPFDCYSCHQKDYQNTVSVNHTALGLPHTCETCHDMERLSWTPARFDHSGFPLLGAHAALPCKSCHAGGYHKGSVACIDCHRDAYNSAKNPDHAAGAYPVNCAVCHGLDSWRPAKFNHETTIFPLRGRHVGVACERCHVNNRYTGTPTACEACHLKDYNASTSPNHALSQFPTTCATCHTVNGWRPATFDHGKTAFPLTGGHANRPCAACHATQWAGLSTQCIACHQDDFNKTTNPNHSAAQFPTDCLSCHTIVAWKPSTFDHDARSFPIYSGKHRGEWQSCATCHTSPGNYKIHTCIDCHEHDKARMDSKHNGVKNYVYATAECYRCHPRGTE